ncbi:Fe-S cluster assembly ATPase SufC [Oenococcus sp.]|uniref:Fe-S cluster assembly ATPase SufC n=1 Tax=Oenococcus sp. TaxID=1979414 RepID=UPI0039EBC02A
MDKLEIKNLHVYIENEETKQLDEILKGVNLLLRTGETHAIMGPNGTGKSTLSETIMGNPKYKVTEGEILLNGHDILQDTVDQRARLGLFLAMQYPVEIKGITNAEFMRAAINAQRPENSPMPIREFLSDLDQKLALLNMPESMADRYLNEGFSGGEKKRNEILQMMMIRPKFAILDEIDSGLDIDALKVVAKGVNTMASPDFGTLMITHYQRLLNYIHPDQVHVMMDGRIVKTGDAALAEKLEAEGYAGLRDELGIQVDLVDDDEIANQGGQAS